ncbi:MAG: Rrf2 family transcriptional regulator [Candidatus Omnitrophota bacterium]|nr:Rrf2 family transcriptional regulator [Candidatus Omnitrophota bacterium]
MKITYKGDYALKTILDLSIHYGNGVIAIHDLAKRLDIPVKFLEQILLELKKGGFVESRRGKIGGYLLAKHPSRIKLGEVVRYIDGPIEPIACVGSGYSNCKDLYRCVFRKIWRDVAESATEIVDNVTFEDLVSKVKSAKQRLVYAV